MNQETVKAKRMKLLTRLIILGALTIFPSVTSANKNKKIELETLKIQGNKELPKMLFIVPWKSGGQSSSKNSHQKLVLHSLYGDLFDPVTPNLDKESLKSLRQVKKPRMAP